ncbi:MAG: 23S rRNA (guanosine(2251)-2'-O)-methyltransferase RlmB [Acidobacteria bacterium]|nr:23S rRNA (guanosine(2251)-2'-O)-methyltransferase RlmB [Acidobacteriota bacterium]
MIIYGFNPVLEALRAGQATKVRALRRVKGRIQEVARAAADGGVPLEWVDQAALDRLARGGVHQGVAADLRAMREYSIEEIVRETAGVPLILVLDGVEDPQNVGSLLRTADAAGVDGVVRQTRHAAPLGGAAAKASAGAIAHVKVAPVVNVARALEELKAAGVWTVGLAVEAGRPYYEVDFTVPTALVLGAEGPGLRRLVQDRCDWLVSIPLGGRVQSLNVAVAGAIALFEAVRQRRLADG